MRGLGIDTALASSLTPTGPRACAMCSMMLSVVTTASMTCAMTSAPAAELLVFDQVAVILAKRCEHVEIEHRLLADRLAVVLHVRRHAHHAARGHLDDLAADDEAHAAADDVDDLLERMAVRIGLHAGLQPVHDQQHVVTAEAGARHSGSDRLLGQIVPAVGMSGLRWLHGVSLD